VTRQDARELYHVPTLHRGIPPCSSITFWWWLRRVIRRIIVAHFGSAIRVPITSSVRESVVRVRFARAVLPIGDPAHARRVLDIVPYFVMQQRVRKTFLLHPQSTLRLSHEEVRSTIDFRWCLQLEAPIRQTSRKAGTQSPEANARFVRAMPVEPPNGLMEKHRCVSRTGSFLSSLPAFLPPAVRMMQPPPGQPDHATTQR